MVLCSVSCPKLVGIFRVRCFLCNPELDSFATWGGGGGGGGSGGAMVLVKLPAPGRPTILITVGQRPTALAVGAGGDCLDIFTLIYPFSPLSPLSLGDGQI